MRLTLLGTQRARRTTKDTKARCARNSLGVPAPVGLEPFVIFPSFVPFVSEYGLAAGEARAERTRSLNLWTSP